MTCFDDLDGKKSVDFGYIDVFKISCSIDLRMKKVI